MTPTDTAARALVLSQSGADCFDALEPEAQESAREHVRAVLQAIRANLPVCYRIPPRLGHMTVRDVSDLSRAMIDAALSE